jgi:hypothetical protein
MSDAKKAAPRIVMPPHLKPVQKTEVAPAPAVDLENPALQSFIRGEGAPAAPAPEAAPGATAAPAAAPRRAEVETAPVSAPMSTAAATPAGATRYPWDDKSASHIKQYQLRLPERLHAMLEFLGETSYRESMHSIALAAIRAEVRRLLKARGIDAEP